MENLRFCKKQIFRLLSTGCLSCVPFIFFISLFSFSAKSQEWAPVGANWYYAARGLGTAPPNSEYYLYQSIKDSVIDNQSCKEISITYYEYNGDTTYLPALCTYQNNDSVYYYNNIYQKFCLLYDFSANAGDTLSFLKPDTFLMGNDSTFRIVVDSVVDFVINSQNLKRFYTTYLDEWTYSGGYIQKIGGLNLLLPTYYISIPEANGPLRCYLDSAINVNFSTNDCDYRITSGIAQNDKVLNLTIYPNPFEARIKIVVEDFKDEIELEVRNVFGKLILHKSMKTNIGILNLFHIPPGIYFLNVLSANKRFVFNTYKLIKI